LKSFFLAIFSGFFILSFYSQTATIKGTVKNINNYYAKDANVHVKKGDNGTTVDENGKFSLTVPAGKSFTLVISSAEFQTFEESYVLGENEVEEIFVILETRSLDPYKVNALDPGTSGLQVYKPIKPSSISSPSDNLETQLKFANVGVRQNSELSAGYNVRGGNFDENLIYVNGIEIYRPFLARSGQQEGLSFINPYMVENIAFSAGGFDAKYGDKLSSVLDVYYHKPREFKATAQASFMGANVYVQDKVGVRSSYLLGARYHTNAYLFGALDTQGEYKPVFVDIQGMYNFAINENMLLSVYGSYADNKYQVIPQSRETNWGSINEALRFTVFYEGQEVTQFQTFMSAVSLQQKAKKGKITLNYVSSVFRTIQSESFDLLGEYKLEELERDLGSDDFGDVAYTRGVGGFLEHARNNIDALVANAYHKGSYNWGANNKFEWGAKYQHEIINDEIHEWNFLDSARFNAPHAADSVGYVDPGAQPYQDLSLSYNIKATNSVSSNRITGFLQNRKGWQLAKQQQFSDSLIQEGDSVLTWVDTTFETHKYLNGTIGVRAHYWDYNGQTVFSPRASLSFTPALFFNHNNQIYRRNIVFRLASGFYYQPPFYREIRNLQGALNPNIRAQKSIHFVFGTDYTFFMWNRSFKFTGEAYYKHLTDIIPYEIDNVRTRYYGVNNAKGYATGLDFKINGQFVNGIESYASLSFLRTYEDILDDYYIDYYNSDGEVIVPGFTANDEAVDSASVEPGYIPRPTDQFASFNLFFQDKMPEEWDTEKIKWSTFKVNLSLVFGTRLPYGPPGDERFKDTLRSSLYRRVDIGFSKDLIGEHTDRTKFGKKSIFKHVERMWVSLEVFNLLDIINTTNYNWITDVSGRKYSVPNNLTSRRINLKLVIEI
jgi:hypothetical protein